MIKLMSWLSSAFKKVKKGVSISNIASGVQRVTGLPTKTIHNKIRDIKGAKEKAKLKVPIKRSDVVIPEVKEVRDTRQLPADGLMSGQNKFIFLGIAGLVIFFLLRKA